MHRIMAVAGVVVREMIRRKDFYVLFVLTAVVVLVMGSANFFDDHKIVGYLKEICLLLVWLSALVIGITTAARQIPAEREQRTIYPLLAKPIARHEILLGKFAGCWAASGLALLVFYIFFALLSASREHALPLALYVQMVVAHWFGLGIIVALALLGSLVFAAPSSNGTICFVVCLGILGLGRYLNRVALGLPEPGQTIVYAIYYAIPHLEMFDFRQLVVHNWPAVSWGMWLLLLLYAVVYQAIFLTAACVIFRRNANLR